MSLFSRKYKKKNAEILPEDVLIDAANLPSFDTSQLEGRVVYGIDSRFFTFLIAASVLMFFFFTYSAFNLQISQGDFYAKKAENNRFESIPLFAERGGVYDKFNTPLVWNETSSTSTEEFSRRKYTEEVPLGSLLGYVKYPKKDKKNGVYITNALTPAGGIEAYLNSTLQGVEGSLFIETDAVGGIVSKTTADLPKKGANVSLTIDIELQKMLYESIHKASVEGGYFGGAALVADVRDGSIVAAVTYPDFDSNIMTAGTDSETIQKYLNDKKSYFLNRYTDGLYAPGSIVKPMFALAALHEGIVTPGETILSTGQLSVPNPYQPGQVTIFKDWKAHGYTNVREAIAVSSDVYFYTVGGGVPGKKGLGITKMAEYSKLFGLEETYPDTFFTSQKSIIPTPEWKKKVFKGEDWRLGDTYHSSIGQYGFSITPMQALGMLMRIVRADERYDTLPDFKIQKDTATTYTTLPSVLLNISKEDYTEIMEGMRMTVTTGNAQPLNFPELKIAGKTGTAQLGVANQYINSWFVGVWPYTEPKYVIVYLLEKGDAKDSRSATSYLAQVMDQCRIYMCDFDVDRKKQ